MPAQIFDKDPLERCHQLGVVADGYPGQIKRPSKVKVAEMIISAAMDMDRSQLYAWLTEHQDTIQEAAIA